MVTDTAEVTVERAPCAGITRQNRKAFLAVAKAAGIGPEATVSIAMSGESLVTISATDTYLGVTTIIYRPDRYNYTPTADTEYVDTFWSCTRRDIDNMKFAGYGAEAVPGSEAGTIAILPTREAEGKLPEDFGFGLAFTAPGMSGDYTRPVLLGIHLESTDDGRIDVQATDTYALCAYKTNPSPDAAGLLPENGLIIPPQVIDALRSLGTMGKRGALFDMTLLRGTVLVTRDGEEEALPIYGFRVGGAWELWFWPIEGGWPRAATVIEPAEGGNAFFFGDRKAIADLCKCIAGVKRNENIGRILLSPRGIVGAAGLEKDEPGPFWATVNPLEFVGGQEVQEQWADARVLADMLEVPNSRYGPRVYSRGANGLVADTDVVSIAISNWSPRETKNGHTSGGYGMFTISFAGIPTGRRIFMPVLGVALPEWLA